MQLPSRVLDSNDVFASAYPIAKLPPITRDAKNRRARIENPTASDWSLSGTRRLFDFLFALLVLSVMGLPMLAIALCVRLTSRGPAFFVQERVGRQGRLFRIYKFRSMRIGSERTGPSLTIDGDRRITGVGRWLRRFKLDEFPQFYNVLRGEMSIVGPRPKLPRHAAIVNMPYRPGITGPATLAFRREEEMLSRIDPTQLLPYYDRQIQPLKARMDVRYMCRATFWSDLRMIGATFMACMTPARTPVIPRKATSTRVLAFPPLSGRESRAANSYEAAN
jgi:lipopolysaccharide/colanic/teichoic acid biosynthesis glycosyltransferase